MVICGKKFNNTKRFSIATTTSAILLVAAPPSCVLLPPLGAPGASCAPSLGRVLWVQPSILRWAFGVMYVELAFFLPGLSRWKVLFLFRNVLEFTVVVGVVGVCVGDCQNDSIVD